MNYILYCAIRSRRIALETFYSALALARRTNQYKIVIVTDRSELVKQELNRTHDINLDQIVIEEVSQKQALNWIGPSQNLFRTKIMCLEYFFEKYERNVLFVDSDTYMQDDFSVFFKHIEKGGFILDKCFNVSDLEKNYENIFGYSKDIVYSDIQNQFAVISYEDKKCIFGMKFKYYSSGVIGFNYHYRHLLRDILQFCDDLYRTTGIRTSEEIAFSNIIQENCTHILEGQYKFFHYAHYKNLRLFLGYVLGIFADGDEDLFNKELEFINDLFTVPIDAGRLTYDHLKYLSLYVNATINHGPIPFDMLILHAFYYGLAKTAPERAAYYDFLKSIKAPLIQ